MVNKVHVYNKESTFHTTIPTYTVSSIKTEKLVGTILIFIATYANYTFIRQFPITRVAHLLHYSCKLCIILNDTWWVWQCIHTQWNETQWKCSYTNESVKCTYHNNGVSGLQNKSRYQSKFCQFTLWECREPSILTIMQTYMYHVYHEGFLLLIDTHSDMTKASIHLWT